MLGRGERAGGGASSAGHEAPDHCADATAVDAVRLMAIDRADFISIVHHLDGVIYRATHLLQLAAKPPGERNHMQVGHMH